MILKMTSDGVRTTASEPSTGSPSLKPAMSPLLALPAELRNEIYIHLLTSSYVPAIRRISTRGYVSDYVLPSLRLTPALLRTCRQIYDEALSVLYGHNIFAAHPSLLASLPYLVSPRRPVTSGAGLGKIRKWYISVRLDVDPKFDAEKARIAFSGAEELEIDVFQAMYGSCDFSVLELFNEVRGVGKAKVIGSTGCASYCRWLEQSMMKLEGEEVVPFMVQEISTGRHSE